MQNSRRCRIGMVAAALSMLAIAACNSDDGKPATDSGVKIDGAPLEDAALAKDALIADGALPADGRVVDGAALKWYRTCGDPVCKNQDAGPGGCTTQVEGASCTPKGDRCSLANACGADLQCDNKVLNVNCPISRRRFKRDIHYLDGPERERLLGALRKLRLARYRLKQSPASGERLGFIIDDGAPAVVLRGEDGVDLYGYASLVAAAVQQQAEQIERLQQRLRKLERQAARCDTHRR